MSSATSTETVRLKPDPTTDRGGATDRGDTTDRGGTIDHGGRLQAALQPWQFFLLAALGCATAVTVGVRGQGVAVVVLLAILMGTTALVGIAALRTLRPLVGPDGDRTRMIGRRTRAALEREKALVLRAIKDLEFDHAMRKLSDADFHDMSTRLRSRAARLIRQLDAGESYRAQIERDLQAAIAAAGDPAAPAASPAILDRPACAACGTANDADARFCKACGQKL